MKGFDEFIKEYSKRIDSVIDEYLKSIKDKYPKVLFDSMSYSLLAGGKRIRPLIVYSLVKTEDELKNADLLALAVELTHTYTLIHDDLPAMDDDDFRRGKPANHKVFGEGVALLAGVSLFNDAYASLLRLDVDFNLKSDILNVFNRMSGGEGILGGQVEDITTTEDGFEPKRLRYIHRHKTTIFFESIMEMGGLLFGYSNDELSYLKRYGIFLGQSYQIADDILDILAPTEDIGKPAGSDLEKKRLTYPALFGLEKSIYFCFKYIDLSEKCIYNLRLNNEYLYKLPEYLRDRLRRYIK